ncbi:MAG: YciI family protein [Archangium sp.]
MRFLVMHKLGPAEPATFAPPPAELIKNMGSLVGEVMKKGAMENGAGLNPKFPRTRLTSRGEQILEEHGPLLGTNELLAHVAMVKVNSKSEAIDIGRRYVKAVGADVTLEIGRVTEPWDIGMAPAPTTSVPESYLLLHMADARSEAGTAPSADEAARVGALMADLSAKKTLTMPLEHVRPSREGRRLKFKAGKRLSVSDGPFAETKELISGFCLLNLPSLDEVLSFATRYGEILGDLEVDVLGVNER